MAKEFECDWNEITNLNVITFNHKLKFLEHLIKERQKAYKSHK